jgi:hypothetical protein
MQYVKISAGILLLVSSAVGAMGSTESVISPLTNLENQIAGYERDPLVSSLAQHFIKPHSEIKPLPPFDEYRNATLIINALLVAFKAKEYPTDKLSVANNTLRPSERLIRLATYALDDICRAWNQTHKPNIYDGSPTIPLNQLERDYLFALHKTEAAIRAAKREDKDATHVASQIQAYLRVLTINK